jgi:predicted RNase H-like HicB family nuclease
MQTATKPTYKYWQEEDFWLGYLEEYPDYMTQGTSLEELKENLADLYKELSDGKISSIRKVDELDIT